MITPVLMGGLILLATGSTPAPAATPDRGLRFDSPGVLDLSDRDLQLKGNRVVEISTLAPADAAAIEAAPAIGEDPLPLRFSDDVYHCAKPSVSCARAGERQRIEEAGGSVRRDGKRLTVTAAIGAVAVFVDWITPETKTADGDAETHWYLGRLAGSGYHRVEVQFGQDAPGNFLINPHTGKTAFVHNAADVVAPSPDGLRLITFNTLDTPSLRIAALDASGPRLVFQCAADRTDSGAATLRFKGWRDATTVDVTIEVGVARGRLQRRAIALRLAQTPSGWNPAASNAALLSAIGFACR